MDFTGAEPESEQASENEMRLWLHPKFTVKYIS